MQKAQLIMRNPLVSAELLFHRVGTVCTDGEVTDVMALLQRGGGFGHNLSIRLVNHKSPNKKSNTGLCTLFEHIS